MSFEKIRQGVQHWWKERKIPEESEESIVGAMLFNLLLSDLEKAITNEVSNFADATKVFN